MAQKGATPDEGRRRRIMQLLQSVQSVTVELMYHCQAMHTEVFSKKERESFSRYLECFVFETHRQYGSLRISKFKTNNVWPESKEEEAVGQLKFLYTTIVALEREYGQLDDAELRASHGDHPENTEALLLVLRAAFNRLKIPY